MGGASVPWVTKRQLDCVAIEQRDAFLKHLAMTRRTKPRRVFVWVRWFGSRAFLLSAIGVNRMRHENADAHEKKKPCCNIQHRIGSKALRWKYVQFGLSTTGRDISPIGSALVLVPPRNSPCAAADRPAHDSPQKSDSSVTLSGPAIGLLVVVSLIMAGLFTGKPTGRSTSWGHVRIGSSIL
jgi:hypothetical protein